MPLSFIRPLPNFLRPCRVASSISTRPLPLHTRRFATTSTPNRRGRATTGTNSASARHTAAVKMALAIVALSDKVDVHIVPILDDNFSYVIHDKESKTATLVDPAVPNEVLRVAKGLDAAVTTSLTTHHHWDHSGGNEELANLLPGIDIIGSEYEKAPAVTKCLSTGEFHTIRGSQLKVRALRTPCHTNGHLCFALEAGKKAVFTGDTLFVAGCGKFFEGSAADMHGSLNRVLAGLDDETLVFCGHEYTVMNLKFAASVEPKNEQVARKLEWAESQVASGQPTVPSSIGDEKTFNPFMRNHVDAVKKAVGMAGVDDVAVMKALRERKNTFRLS